MLTAGPTRETTTPWLRGLRSRPTLTGTGLAYPKAPSPLSTSSAGRMMVPNGSMWRSGLSVRRPARLAVSSPKASATAPWDTSCRITEGISAQNSRIAKGLRWCVRTTPTTTAMPAITQAVVRGLTPGRRGPCAGGPQRSLTGSVLRRAVDAVPGGGLRLHAQRVDQFRAVVAHAVGPIRQLDQGLLDLGQGLPERGTEGFDLATLRCHLARIGEVGVVGKPAFSQAELLELGHQVIALLLQQGAVIDGRRLMGHVTRLLRRAPS